MINWKRKLSSRKFWALLAVFAVSVLSIFGASAEAAERITGLITAAGAVITYILAEAHVDAADRGKDEL